MLNVKNLSVSYGSHLPYVIKELSFSIEKGDILNVLGQNAVGKTTLIKCIARELSRYNGNIYIDNKDIQTYTIKEYSKLVGMVFSSFNTYQNLLVADYLATGFLNQMALFEKPTTDMIVKAHAILERFGKQELFNKKIDQLSSGEKQIVMISRVLLQNPEIIIVDEPTSNLDVKNQISVLEQIQQLSVLGYTVIITTHNPGHALALEGKTLLLGKNGKYLFGETKEIINSRYLTEFYDLKVTVTDDLLYKHIVFENNDNSSIKIIL